MAEDKLCVAKISFGRHLWVGLWIEWTSELSLSSYLAKLLVNHTASHKRIKDMHALRR